MQLTDSSFMENEFMIGEDILKSEWEKMLSEIMEEIDKKVFNLTE